MTGMEIRQLHLQSLQQPDNFWLTAAAHVSCTLKRDTSY